MDFMPSYLYRESKHKFSKSNVSRTYSHWWTSTNFSTDMTHASGDWTHPMSHFHNLGTNMSCFRTCIASHVSHFSVCVNSCLSCPRLNRLYDFRTLLWPFYIAIFMERIPKDSSEICFHRGVFFPTQFRSMSSSPLQRI